MDEPSTALPENLRAELARFFTDGDAVLTEFVDNLNAAPVPQTIYHYTDWAGLRGILETGTIRFGDIFYLNDPSELRHGVETALVILDEKGTTTKELPELSMFARQFRNILSSGVEAIAHFFVCCFSRNGNDLGQWRSYADNGRGYVLGFDGAALVKAFSADCGPNGQTFQITYPDERLKGMQRRLVDLVVPLVSLPRGQGLDEATLNEYMRELQMRLALLVLQSSILFKHPAYMHEDEYRMLQIFPVGAVTDVKFRNRPYSLARYREYDWKRAAPDALQSIMIGPAADAENAKRFAKDLLRSFHPISKDMEIGESKIPYRVR